MVRPTMTEEQLRVEHRPGGLHAVCFSAMACPCEVLVDTTSTSLARDIGKRAASEAWRIEQRYSRYQSDSILSRLNSGSAEPVELDHETAALLEYARQCHAESGGRFDITSGVLRRVWNFSGGGLRNDRVPDSRSVEALLPLVGFEKLEWNPPYLRLPPGMELDLGGIGKEYAVDRALQAAVTATDKAVLVNFGGDLACRGAPASGPWQIGVERPAKLDSAALVLEMATSGGLATSGDTRRFVMHEGKRLGHILDPRTGWPVEGAPASVTVAASTCLEAGTLATLALLEGTGAEAFLKSQGIRYWAQWA